MSDFMKIKIMNVDNMYFFNSKTENINENVKEEKPHQMELSCLNKCSIWSLSLISRSNKFSYNNMLYGKCSNDNEELFRRKGIFNENAKLSLPIDISQTQQLVLDKTQERVKFSIEFDLTNSETAFKKINYEYTHYSFELILNAFIHKKLFLRENINFIVKGYDIIKSIQNKLYELQNTSGVKKHTKFFSIVFSNVQCSLAIDFLMNSNVINYNNNNHKYDDKSDSSTGQVNYYNICKSDIKITRLYIEYFLPIILFSNTLYEDPRNLTLNTMYNNKSQYNKNLQNQDQTSSKKVNRTFSNKSQNFNKFDKFKQDNSLDKSYLSTNNTLSNEYYIPKKNKPTYNQNNKMIVTNFCNWKSFMTTSTPLVYQCEDLTVKDFFKAFDKVDSFGLDCLFKWRGSYIKNCYYPTLSSFYLEITNSKSLFLLNGNQQQNTTNDLNSTLDSVFSHISHISLDNEKKCHSIQFLEDKPLHFRPTFKAKISEIFDSYRDHAVEELTLGDISEESYFSILWTPKKTQFIDDNNISFLIYYSFREKIISNSIKFLPVIGIITNRIQDEFFWFSNQALVNQLTFREDFINNKNAFEDLIQNLDNFVHLQIINRNQFQVSSSIDINVLTK
jgi:hypothetical protein